MQFHRYNITLLDDGEDNRNNTLFFSDQTWRRSLVALCALWGPWLVPRKFLSSWAKEWGNVELVVHETYRILVINPFAPLAKPTSGVPSNVFFIFLFLSEHPLLACLCNAVFVAGYTTSTVSINHHRHDSFYTREIKADKKLAVTEEYTAIGRLNAGESRWVHSGWSGLVTLVAEWRISKRFRRSHSFTRLRYNVLARSRLYSRPAD